MTLDDALWAVRVAGALVAIIWALGLLRVRAMPPFPSQGRVQAISVAFVLVGLVAFAVSFIPPGSR